MNDKSDQNLQKPEEQSGSRGEQLITFEAVLKKEDVPDQLKSNPKARLEASKPSEKTLQKAVEKLEKLGFNITGKGSITVECAGKKENIERIFNTKIIESKISELTVGENVTFSFDRDNHPPQIPGDLKDCIENIVISPLPKNRNVGKIEVKNTNGIIRL